MKFDKFFNKRKTYVYVVNKSYYLSKSFWYKRYLFMKYR